MDKSFFYVEYNAPEVEMVGEALVQEENNAAKAAEERLKALLQKLYKD